MVTVLIKTMRPWLQSSQKDCDHGSSPHKNTAT